jgi:o-succinylbenzoate synthase
MISPSVSVQFARHDLQFTFTARTSRSVLTVKPTWILRYQFPERPFPIYAEANVLEGLSPENSEEYEAVLTEYSLMMGEGREPDFLFWRKNPALLFAHETALRTLGGSDSIWTPDSAFAQGCASIPINGLVWMDDIESMKKQAVEKIKAGFDCVKIKVGALDFDEEYRLLKRLRSEFGPGDLTLRVDANGGFTGKDPHEKLKRLSDLHIHSIEQPIHPGMTGEMARLCAESPLPIALDEEIIGVKTLAEKEQILDDIKPQYVILKPSLIGGFSKSEEWITAAEKRNVGWWFTSALESNIGLSAIAHHTFSKNPQMPQGLGTGRLYSNNFDSPLEVRAGTLHFLPEQRWDFRHLAPLWNH